MKYTDVTVGQLVLYNSYRRNHKRYSVHNSYAAEVIAKGVEHKYHVTEGGWAGRSAYKTTNEGIRVKFLPYKRRGYTEGEAPVIEVEEHESTTLAAHLTPADDASLALIAEEQRNLVASAERYEAEKDEDKRIILAFAQAGYEVSLQHGGGNVIIDREDVSLLLESLSLLSEKFS